ncbi:uncharacterized protein YALI1_F30086g [Yarrowia lipolytica]|uniref:Uncharacterized protein n=1 Tax=Yarrowia lipolytica TaxID=4952 RepID=A0A1D8NPM0_YARLL|nr:hypothetical protein YALI1_F30086g [Yarrowia lipolytica]
MDISSTTQLPGITPPGITFNSSKPGYWRSINHTLLNHCGVRCEAHVNWFVDASSSSFPCRGLVVVNHG